MIIEGGGYDSNGYLLLNERFYLKRYVAKMVSLCKDNISEFQQYVC